MIVTNIACIEEQLRFTPGLKKAIDFLRHTDLERLLDGRTEIDGNRVFALVQRYQTMSGGAPNFERHRKYIDIQVIISGVEVIGWTHGDCMEVTDPYDEIKDICFGKVAPGTWTPVRLEAGQLAVLWPSDAHAPKQASGVPAKVSKIVVKVAVE